MTKCYILDDHRHPVETTFLHAMAWCEMSDIVVGYTEFSGGVVVETRFIGHATSEERHPWLFQTTVTGGPLGGSSCYYSAWDEAKAGHDEMVRNLAAARVQQMRAAGVGAQASTGN